MEDIVYPTLGREDLNLTVETGIHLFIFTLILSFYNHSFILPFTHSSFTYSFIHFYINPFILHLLIHSSFHLHPSFLHIFIYFYVNPLINPFIHSSIYPSSTLSITVILRCASATNSHAKIH